jgi:hypothetical protein|tara:strand:- start:465 stop:638 length:174 start_codon:yes stop_codon:yes gene_type:complete
MVMNNSPFNKLTMKAEERLAKVKELTSKILYLKKNPAVDSKKTIQKLQQQINDVLYE